MRGSILPPHRTRPTLRPRKCAGSAKHRRKAGCARTFGKRLLMGEIGHDRALDVASRRPGARRRHTVWQMAMVRSVTFLTAMPSASVEPPQRAGCPRKRVIHGRIELDLDAEISICRFDVLGRDRHAAEMTPAAADRHDDAVEVRLVLKHFEADRALSGDDLVVVIGVDEDESLFLDHGLGGDLAVGQRFARQDDLRAMRPRALDLGRRRRLRHHDGRRDAEPLGVIGDRLGMIAGRHGDDAARPFRRGQTRHLVIGAAVLEGTGDLQILEFDVDFARR